MKDATSLFNWGFDPTGTALGGQSAPSMPESRQMAQGFGAPMLDYGERGMRFTKNVERRYGRVSNPRGGVFDPRGRTALSPEVADYFEGDAHPGAAVKDFDAEAMRIMQGGNPQIAPYRPRTNVNMRMLQTEATGLTPQNARFMKQALEQYDPGVVQTIQVPRQRGLPQVSNELGMVSRDGAVPNTYLNQVLKPAYGPDLGDAVARVRAGQPRQTEYVDENGIVHKYAPGTGPYDAPGGQRPGGIAGAKVGTVVGGAGVGAARSGRGQVIPIRGRAQHPVHGGAPQPSDYSGFAPDWRDSVGYNAMGVNRVGGIGQTETAAKKTPWGHIFGGLAAAGVAILGVSMLAQGVR